MSYDWGPHYIVPSEVFKTYSGGVKLRENYDEELLSKTLETLGISGPIVKVTNPWYYRKKNTDNWIKIGESEDKSENFAIRWDTSNLDNGQYEVLGLMHVFVKMGDEEQAIAKENVVGVAVEN